MASVSRMDHGMEVGKARALQRLNWSGGGRWACKAP